MDQIFIDALVDSRKYAPVQYVLCKGIERRRISGDNRVMLLHMLKHGWDIAAKFNNGSDEEDGTKCWLSFYGKADDKPLYNTVYLDADRMNDVRDTISVLKAHGLRRYKDMVMHILEVDLEVDIEKAF